MAPRKPAATAKLPKKHKASESNKVTKRPARGYHKYKNGLLNVTPKGGERELVESNSKSPLLSLPAEIRNRIWEYTLGYTNYEVYGGWYREPPFIKKLSDDAGPGLALLRACRQVYSEAALMPLHLSTFVFYSTSMMHGAIKLFKKHQRKQVKHIKFYVSWEEAWWDTISNTPEMTKYTLLGFFPALRSIEFTVHHRSDSSHDWASFAELEADVQRHFALLLQVHTISLTVTKLDRARLDTDQQC